MSNLVIEELAATVARAHELKFPVNLEKICDEESIAMAPGSYSRTFHGRIEFHASEGTFILFYPEPRSDLPIGRVRFSICHELGHFYIPEHRDLIVSGRVHNSVEPFRPVKNRIENEADLFASSLLIPSEALAEFIGSRKFLSLDAIFHLSDAAQASIQASAYRYVATTDEPCVAVLSKDGRIVRTRSSLHADALGFGGLGNQHVPEKSQALKCLGASPRDVLGGAAHTAEWFSERRYGAKLWEESASLGRGYVLSLLSWEDSGR